MANKDAVRDILRSKLEAVGVPKESLEQDWIALFQEDFDDLASEKNNTADAIADALLLCIAQWAQQQPVVHAIRDSKAEGALKILFVGNSLTYENCLAEVVAALLEHVGPSADTENASEKPELKIYQVAQAGMTLENHWKYKVALYVMAAAGPWDYVVLQEQSVRSQEGSPKMFHYGQLLGAEIHKSGAKILVFSTWTNKAVRTKQTQKALDQLFASLAVVIDATIVPVGACWGQVLDGEDSLNLYSDEQHPSPEGTYLAACAFYAIITGLSPQGLPAVVFSNDGTPLPALSPSAALHLQKAAWVICNKPSTR